MTDSNCNNARSDILEARRHPLSEEAERRLREHLAACAECRAFDTSERALDNTLARLPERRAPGSLKARLMAERNSAVRGATTSKKRPYGGWIAVSAAAACLSVIGFGLWQSHSESQRMGIEAVNDHLRVLYAQQPVEIASGGIHQVKPWFEGRLDFAPRLGFEGNDEFVLTGGSVAYFIDRKAAVFVFKHRLHLMSLFVFRADGLPWPLVHNRKIGSASAVETQSRGFGALLFRNADLGYALVSDVEPQTLDRLGTEVAKSLIAP